MVDKTPDDALNALLDGKVSKIKYELMVWGLLLLLGGFTFLYNTTKNGDDADPKEVAENLLDDPEFSKNVAKYVKVPAPTPTPTPIQSVTPWLELLLPTADWDSGYPSDDPDHSFAKCRRNGEWIEFRGILRHPPIVGWEEKAVKYLLLPQECRPKSSRYTEMACHGTEKAALVCNNDFSPDGYVHINSKVAVNQQRLDGVRIWGGDE